MTLKGEILKGILHMHGCGYDFSVFEYNAET